MTLIFLPIFQLKVEPIREIMYLGDLLERSEFLTFWSHVYSMTEITKINGFFDSVRKFVCHVVGITYEKIDKNYLAQLLGALDDNTLKQWIKKSGWKLQDRLVFVGNQDDNIKTKNISEKIDFDHIGVVLSSCQ